MADKKIHVKLLTPVRTVFEGDADYIVLRTTEGDMGVMPGHEPYMAMLDYGILRTFTGKTADNVFALLGGFAIISNDEAIITSPVAEVPEKMNERLAEMEAARAENEQREEKANLEMHRAETALRHALVNMEVSTYSIIKGSEVMNNEDENE